MSRKHFIQIVSFTDIMPVKRELNEKYNIISAIYGRVFIEWQGFRSEDNCGETVRTGSSVQAM